MDLSLSSEDLSPLDLSIQIPTTIAMIAINPHKIVNIQSLHIRLSQITSLNDTRQILNRHSLYIEWFNGFQDSLYTASIVDQATSLEIPIISDGKNAYF